MQQEAKGSTTQGRLRRRKRFFAFEVLRLGITDLADILSGHRESVRVRWPALDEAMTVTRPGEHDLFITGAIGETGVRITTVRRGANGVRKLFTCPSCTRTCAELFLPPGQSSFGCRRCRRIRYRERSGPSPICRLQDDWARIGGQIDQLRVMQTRGERPEVGGVEVDVRALRRQLRDLQRRVQAAGPLQAG